MTRVFQVFSVMLLGMLLFPSCNEGIQAPPETPAGPTPGVPGFAGTITYKNWPPADSLVDLRLVAFKKFPPGDILTEVLQDSAIVYPPLGGPLSLPFNVDTTHYFAPTPGNASYRYVVVAQRYGQDILHDWRAVGQYDLDTNLAVPSPIQVPADDTLMHVDINVDFKHLPPQPF